MEHNREIHRSENGSNSAAESGRFWDQFNVKASVFNYLVIALIGVITAYTSFVLAQATITNEINQLKEQNKALKDQMTERSAARSVELKEIKDQLKNEVVTEKTLNLTIKPIADEQARQREILEKIAAAVHVQN
jgi:hypothetical protein